ncbi:MAG: tripartite tricarboxylate transporter TctB family protein, partial [Pseudomonadota bacterium]|nr:tripartite tricarboxylate transporter TctB family protein [Pseudomonadota bacterium]
MAKPSSGPETPGDSAPYIFFVTDGPFEPVVTEVPPERKFNSADLFAFRRVSGDIVLSAVMLAMALFLIASFAGETGWAKRKLPADMGQYIGIQVGLLDAEGRVARLG